MTQRTLDWQYGYGTDVRWSDASQTAFARSDGSNAPVVDLETNALPWRFISYGDSRVNGKTPIATIGIADSTTAVRDQRSIGWALAALGDAEYVADYGLGGDTVAAWNSATRANSKTIANALSIAADGVYIQYGINDIGAWNGTSPTQSAFTATLISNLQAVVSAFVAAGRFVIFESINAFDPTASSSAFATFTVAKEQIRRDANAAMRTWLAQSNGRAVYVDTDAVLLDPVTGYGRTSLIFAADNLGVHLNRFGGQLLGIHVARQVRSFLPQKSAVVSVAPTYRPNFIVPGTSLLATSAETGTLSFGTPTWGALAGPVTLPSGFVIPAGTPFAELTMTATALASGIARGRLEVHATGISGASPTFPVAIGDLLQGGGIVTIDSGVDGQQAAGVQVSQIRHRLYSDAKFADVFGFINAADQLLPSPFYGRFACPAFITSTASVGISAPSPGAGYPLQVIVEFNAINAPARIRVYAPWLRAISLPQPSAISVGSSPFTFTLTRYVSDQPASVVVAGGTVSQIQIQRSGGSALTTGATSGTFHLARGDSIIVTYSAAPTMTLIPA